MDLSWVLPFRSRLFASNNFSEPVVSPSGETTLEDITKRVNDFVFPDWLHGDRSFSDSIIDTPNSSDTVDGSSPYNVGEYLEGLFSSVGAENQANRLYNSAESQAQREWSSAEAALNRSWQENLSNTAYSRAVNDLKQAGLNPILAVGGMSSTPSGAVLAGSTASYQTGGGDRASDILNALANSASAVSDVLMFFLPKLSKLLK